MAHDKRFHIFTGLVEQEENNRIEEKKDDREKFKT